MSSYTDIEEIEYGHMLRESFKLDIRKILELLLG